MARWTRMVMAALVVTALVGCGGDDDDGASDATSTTDAETTTEAETTTTTEATTTVPSTTLPDRPIDVLLTFEEVGPGFTPLPPVDVNPDDVCDRTSNPSTVQEGVLAVDGAFQAGSDVVYQAITWYADAAQAAEVFDEAVGIMGGCDGYDTTLPGSGAPARWEVAPVELGATFPDQTAAWAGTFGTPDSAVSGTWVYVQQGAVVMSLNTGVLGTGTDAPDLAGTAALVEKALAKL